MLATDGAGAVIWKENYRPYGERLNNQAGSSKNKLGFAGKQFDPATGLSYMGARYYDPVLGRFMGVDPVDFKEDNIHSSNRYAYANNNPYKYVDPDGRSPVHAIAFAIGFTIDVAAQRMVEGKSWSEVSYSDAALSGVGAALTGGAGGQLASLAIKGSITAGQAVAGTALAGGIAGASVSATSDLSKGGAPSAAKMAIGAAGGAAGSAAGAKIANTAASTLQKMLASGGVMDAVASTTRTSLNFGATSTVRIGTSAGQEAGKVVADTTSAIASKAAEQRLPAR